MNQQAELASIHSPVEQAHITLETGPHGLDATAWIGKLMSLFTNQIKFIFLTAEYEYV